MTLQNDTSRLLAVLLIAIGLFFLAANAGWFGAAAPWFWAIALTTAGSGFILTFLRNRTMWWSLIPGFALLGLGGASLVPGGAAGSLFLGLAGLGFVTVYLTKPQHWWSLIPGGTLLTLALIAGVTVVWPAFQSDWLFFLGLSATFGTLVALPEQSGKQRWAIYPALGTLALALMLMVSSKTASVLFPLLLMSLAALELWRGSRPPNRNTPKA